MGEPELPYPSYNLEDWRNWEGRWELIRGNAYDMTPAPNLKHQETSRNLLLLLGNALEEARKKYGGQCQVFHAPTDVFLLESVVQPDLLVVCDPSKLSERGIEGAPDLVVEILSPRTSTKDWMTKRWLYQEAGVPEYLILDPQEGDGVLLVLENGQYRESARLQWQSKVKILHGSLEITLPFQGPGAGSRERPERYPTSS